MTLNLERSWTAHVVHEELPVAFAAMWKQRCWRVSDQGCTGTVRLWSSDQTPLMWQSSPTP